MNTTPSILFVSSIFPPDIGGPATYVSTLAHALVEKDWTVNVITYGSHKKKDQPFLVWYVKKRLLPLRFLSMIIALFLHGHNSAIFYAHGSHLAATIPALLIGRLFKKPVGIKITGDYAWEQARNANWTTDDIDEFQKKHYGIRINALKKIQKWAVQHATFVVVPSQYLKQMVIDWGTHEKKISVIYNASSMPLLSLRKPVLSPVLFFSAGRFVKWKGFDIIIKTFDTIHKMHPNTQLVIAGDGPMRNKLKDQASNTTSSGAILFTGNLSRTNMEEWYRRVHCFILYSGYEGLSHVLLEALSFKLPVIASAKGGNTELIQEGINGLLVPWNNPHLLQKSFEQFLCNPQNTIKHPGFIHPELFSWETLVAQTKSLLQSILINTNP